KWHMGGEFDIVESFGFDNGGGNTNFNGAQWHSDSVGGSGDTVSYASWPQGMAHGGFTSFDATQWRTWTMLYNKDNTFHFYCDGKEVQNGSSYFWTDGAGSGGTPISMTFLFDGAWGHTQVQSVNHTLPASALDGTYYEWDYSRIYLR